jgi:hypothetical protein
MPLNGQPSYWWRISHATPPKHAEPTCDGDLCNDCRNLFSAWWRNPMTLLVNTSDLQAVLGHYDELLTARGASPLEVAVELRDAINELTSDET